MKLDSKWFDSIRIRPDEERVARESGPRCEAPGCRRRGAYRAPKGRMREGEYHNFCLEHVRDYNRSYNWFSGMSDADVAAWQASRATGHRPTWAMGSKGAGRGEGRHAGGFGFGAEFFSDPFDLFPDEQHGDAAATVERRRLGNAERRSLDTLNLDETASGPEIKARYKELVKRHHPDANGGDRSKEDALRRIIEAYNTLKASGFYRDC